MSAGPPSISGSDVPSQQRSAFVVDISDDEPGAEPENSDDELSKQDTIPIVTVLTICIERLSKDWKSPIYAFYEPLPEVVNIKGRRCHEFKCAARGCNYKSWCYLDTKDKSSTGNLIKHVKSCWGDEAWMAANDCKNAAEARETITKPIARSGSITAIFKRNSKGKVTYSHRMHTKTETKYEHLETYPQ